VSAIREEIEQVRLQQLFARIKDGERDALGEIYKIAAPILFGAVVRIVRDRDAALDILQDTFVTLTRRAQDYDASRGTPLAWLATIARRKAIDHLRKPRAASIEDQQKAAAEIAGIFIDPLARAESEEDQARIAEGLSRLEPERLQMVLLAYVFGWSREQLGEHFRKPTGTVKTWLHRSFTELRERAKDVREEPVSPPRAGTVRRSDPAAAAV